MNSVVQNSNPQSANKSVQFLASTSLLASLGPHAIETLHSMATVIDLRRNKTLWQVGQMADAIYILRTGAVREYVSHLDDRETTIGIYARRTTIGLAGAVENNTWFTTAIAHEDSTLYRIPTALVTRLSEQFPRLSKAITNQIFSHMKQAQLLTPNMLNSSAQSRLAEVLIELASAFAITDSRGTIINIKLTHRIIATMTGTTRETVSFAILDLRKRGLIKNDGKRFIVTNMDALKAIVTA